MALIAIIGLLLFMINIVHGNIIIGIEQEVDLNGCCGDCCPCNSCEPDIISDPVPELESYNYGSGKLCSTGYCSPEDDKLLEPESCVCYNDINPGGTPCKVNDEQSITVNLFEPHNVPGQNADAYQVFKTNGFDTYVITQRGIGRDKTLRVEAHFKKCKNDENICISKVLYYEPGIKFIITPRHYVPPPVHPEPVPVLYPACSVVVCDGEEQEINLSNGKVVFYAKKGKVVVNTNMEGPENMMCTNIWGRKGFVVQVCNHLEHTYLSIWAKKNLNNNVYGLCDTITPGKPIPTYYKEPVTGSRQTDLNLFISSCKV